MVKFPFKIGNLKVDIKKEGPSRTLVIQAIHRIGKERIEVSEFSNGFFDFIDSKGNEFIIWSSGRVSDGDKFAEGLNYVIFHNFIDSSSPRFINLCQNLIKGLTGQSIPQHKIKNFLNAWRIAEKLGRKTLAGT